MPEDEDMFKGKREVVDFGTKDPVAVANLPNDGWAYFRVRSGPSYEWCCDYLRQCEAVIDTRNSMIEKYHLFGFEESNIGTVEGFYARHNLGKRDKRTNRWKPVKLGWPKYLSKKAWIRKPIDGEESVVHHIGQDDVRVALYVPNRKTKEGREAFAMVQSIRWPDNSHFVSTLCNGEWVNRGETRRGGRRMAYPSLQMFNTKEEKPTFIVRTPVGDKPEDIGISAKLGFYQKGVYRLSTSQYWALREKLGQHA